ncbi:MAG: hypothetical protein JNL74_05325, partial [Fibrobacteres bacterium]|nr:hypothetical protein [Fibrobacterota bacterium]
MKKRSSHQFISRVLIIVWMFQIAISVNNFYSVDKSADSVPENRNSEETNSQVKTQIIGAGAGLPLLTAVIAISALFPNSKLNAQTIKARSIGTNATVLYSTGSVSTNPTRDTLTFSGATLPLATIGEGDKIIFDVNSSAGGPETCYVKLSINSTILTLQQPSSATYTSEDYQIKRAFNNLSTWESASPGDLIADNSIWKGVCYNDGAIVDDFIINGSVTDATRYVWLTVAKGHRHSGNGYTTTGVRLEPNSFNRAIDNQDAYTLVEWIQVKVSNNCTSIQNTGSDYMTVKNCIVYAPNGVTGVNTGITASGINSKVINSVVYGPNFFYGIYADGGANVYNSTVFKTTTGIYATSATTLAKNCISMGNTSADWSGTFNGTSMANMSSDASAPGTMAQMSMNAFNQFVDTSLTTPNFHLKPTSNAVNAGDSGGISSSFMTDIDDSVRYFGFWDIGADEYSPAPSLRITWSAPSNGVWGLPSNWTPAQVPNIGDTAVFDGTSTYNCNINQNIITRQIRIQTGYTGTLTQGSNNIALGTGGFYQEAGTFVGGNKRISIGEGGFKQIGGTFTSTSDTLALEKNMTITGGTFNPSTGTIEFTGNFNDTINASSTSFNNVKFNLGNNFRSWIIGTLDVNGNLDLSGASNNWIDNGTITLAGNLVSSINPLSGNTAITFDGSLNQTINTNGWGRLPSGLVTINKPAGMVQLLSNLSLNGPITISMGKLNQGANYSLKTGGTLTVDAAGALINVGAGGDTLGGNIINNGTITLNGNGGGSGDIDGIYIRSTVDGTQRSWSGSGIYNIVDCNIKDMSGTITAWSCTDMSGNAGFTFNSMNPPVVWDGGGISNNWNESTNWSLDYLPQNSDSVVFDATSSKACSLDVTDTVQAIALTSGYTGIFSFAPIKLVINGTGDFQS